MLPIAVLVSNVLKVQDDYHCNQSCEVVINFDHVHDEHWLKQLGNKPHQLASLCLDAGTTTHQVVSEQTLGLRSITASPMAPPWGLSTQRAQK